MNSYYQLILLGDTISEACRKVKRRFFELLRERGLDKQLVAVLDGTLTLTPREEGGYDSAKPTFAFYFGKQNHGDKDVDALKKLIGNGDAVYPVFFTMLNINQWVKISLHLFGSFDYYVCFCTEN